MKLPHRRQFLHLGAGAVALPFAPRRARAQTYPTRPVRIFVGVTPGSPQDVLSRLIGQWLSDRLGQPFVIDNRPGAGANIATEAVVRAPADGYALLSVGPSVAVNATLYDKLSFNFIRDIAPVACLVNQAQIVVVHPSVPARTVPEFIAYAKANPNKINFASSGIGAGNHVAGELFKMLAGVEMVHVPYRGAGPATTDLLAGQVQAMFVAPVAAVECVRAGRLRLLAVTTASRVPTMPDVPAVAETVPDYESTAWFGICAPKAIPADIVDLLNKEINDGLADSRMQARLADLGGGISTMSPASFGSLIAQETEKWGKVVKFAGVKAE
jgi:tripartite-type tricarboxylate transporter receptor subunit TctC